MTGSCHKTWRIKSKLIIRDQLYLEGFLKALLAPWVSKKESRTKGIYKSNFYLGHHLRWWIDNKQKRHLLLPRVLELLSIVESTVLLSKSISTTNKLYGIMKNYLNISSWVCLFKIVVKCHCQEDSEQYKVPRIVPLHTRSSINIIIAQ